MFKLFFVVAILADAVLLAKTDKEPKKDCSDDPFAVEGCGVNCGNRCSDYDKRAVILCQSEDSYCPGGCDCVNGRVLDENTGKCTLPEDCTPVCSENEVYSDCINGGCGPKKCSDKKDPIKCAKIPESECIKGCICKEGYLRANGTCVPKDQCPGKRCDGDEEPKKEVEDSSVNLAKRCSNYDMSALIFNVSVIILSPACKKNEVYSDCINGGCGPKKCSEINDPIKCVKILASKCIKGCLCREGYLRANGNCVPKDQCPGKRTCGRNETLSPCANGGCRRRKCSDKGILCIDPRKCEPGCICKENYYKDTKGKCVLKEDCDTSQCGENEVFSTCSNAVCGYQNCSEIGGPEKCIRLDPAYCKPGCVCKQDHLRDSNQKCVLRKDCENPKKCNADEVMGCANSCPPERTCKNKDIQFNCKQVDDDYKCTKPKCVCKDGLYRNSGGLCVTSAQCATKPTCGKNEIYSNCSNCVRRNCADIGTSSIQNVEDCKNCQGGCVCQDGFYKDTKGNCVSKNECDICGNDKNQVPGCGVYCNQRCKDVGKPPGPCILLCKFNACNCKPGFYLNDKGFCVPPDKCPTKPTCGKNEVYSNCSNCVSRNCKDIGTSSLQNVEDCKNCQGGCVCQEGFYKDTKGNCVSQNECDICGNDKNQVPGCGVYCNRRCKDVGKPPGYCILLCKLNACDCKPGFYLNDKGFCVPPDKCPPIKPQCRTNEIYTNCSNQLCGPRKCSQIGLPVTCLDVKENECTEGCICNKNYYENSKGYCVSRDQCDSCANDPNKIPGCGNYCNQRCGDKERGPIGCSLACAYNACGCRKDTYLDNVTKLCVPYEQCTPTCKGKNEVVHNCINAVCRAQKCSERDQPVPCPDVKKCDKGCACAEGYLRHPSSDECIPEGHCPSQPTICGKNEVLDNCSNAICRPQYCSQKNQPIACPAVSKCIKGCVCKEGYLKDQGKCIPEDKCPLPTCPGKNEKWNSCAPCREQTCYPEDNKGIFCAAVCIGSCVCVDGYVRGPDQKCIPKNQCPPSKCPGKNEKWNSCAPCREQTCNPEDNKGHSCPAKCYGSCVCIDGYVRGPDKKCIPQNECPPKPITCGKNEVLDNCSNSICRPQNCSQRYQPINCPEVPVPKCIKGCVCKEGYLKDQGKCIPEDKCPLPECPGKYEKWDPCLSCVPQDCYPEKYKDLVCLAYCNGSCRCIDGYVRGSDGKCMPKDQCPPKCNGKYEYWNECAGCIPQDCYPEKYKNLVCTKNCRRRCDCIEGYVRGEDGKCMPKDKCPKKCNGKYEVWNNCSTCIPQDCYPEKYYTIKCAPVCRCDCIEGYVRGDDGKCMPKDKCPQSK